MDDPVPPAELTQTVEQLVETGSQVGPIIAQSTLLLLIMLWVTTVLGKMLARILIRAGMSERKAVLPVTALHLAVLLIAALFVLTYLGIPITSLLRILGVIAMVLLALYVILKPFVPRLPFTPGDTIVHGAVFGEVQGITLVHSEIRAIDGKTVFVPNHKLLNEPVTNISVRPNRRADAIFYIPWDEEVDEVRRVVLEALEADDRVLPEPAPSVGISKFEPGYRQMTARFWLENAGYVAKTWAMNERIETALTAAGIRMANERLEIAERGSEPAG